AVIRGFLLRQRLRKEFRREFDSVLRDGEGEIPTRLSPPQRFERLCRYIIASMDADTLQESYVRSAPQDAKSLMLHLHVLVTFTSTSSWKVLKDKTYEPLRPVLSQLCASVGSHLMGKGSLYGALQALLLRGLARAKPSLKRAPLVATINLALRYTDTSEKGKV
ncbi:hypothetical protein MTO96_040989, partial [Rhipicephalus appendiculatus]